MKNTKLTLSRLQKQEKKIQQDPIPNVLVARKGILNFHFCIYGLSQPYRGGFYHGVLQLHQDYPFAPPKLLFFTPSGRFQTLKPICTSFTNYHKQSWTSAWTVRTMLTATVSFMTSEETGVGGLNQSQFQRKNHARKSLELNLKSQQFCQLFKQKLLQSKLTTDQSFPTLQQNNQKIVPRAVQSPMLMWLYGLLIIVLIIFGWIKSL